MVNTKIIMQKHGISPNKNLGQNFLTDINVLKKIVEVSNIDKDDLVIEIGPGLGALSVLLAESAGKLIVVEIDKYLIPALEDTLASYSNVEILNQDFLKLDIEEIFNNWCGPKKVTANLPYYITTPIIFKLLESGVVFDRMVFMVQKEVAKRICATPHNKDYGSLSVSVQYYSKPKIAFTVSPNCFIPKPDVDSAVVVLDLLKKPAVDVVDKKFFFSVVKNSFGQRRKTLVNSLSACMNNGINKEQLQFMLKQMSIKENVRAEELDIKQFAEISNYLYKLYNFL